MHRPLNPLNPLKPLALLSPCAPPPDEQAVSADTPATYYCVIGQCVLRVARVSAIPKAASGKTPLIKAQEPAREQSG